MKLGPTVIAPSIENAPISNPSVPAAGRESYVGVYECTVNGQRVVSDRPCGSGAQARTLVVEQPNPRDAAIAQQRLWPAQQQPAAGRSDSAPAPRVDSGTSTGAVGLETQCRLIDQEIDDINARMRRGGYGTEEGNWLRARWHAAKNRRFELGCGR
jgi:hypothetical protein